MLSIVMIAIPPTASRSSAADHTYDSMMEESKRDEGVGRGVLGGRGKQRDAGNKRSADDAGLASRAEAEEGEGETTIDAPLLHLHKTGLSRPSAAVVGTF